MLREEGAGYTDKAHNQLLQVAATTGLLGLAAYLWVFASYFLNAYLRGGWALFALSGGVLAYVLQIQTSFSTIVDEVALWAVLGASVAVMRLQEGGPAEPGPRRRARVPERPLGKAVRRAPRAGNASAGWCVPGGYEGQPHRLIVRAAASGS